LVNDLHGRLPRDARILVNSYEPLANSRVGRAASLEHGLGPNYGATQPAQADSPLADARLVAAALLSPSRKALVELAARGVSGSDQSF
jgi:hypothetical protein